MKKKAIALFLSTMMVGSLAACGGSGNSSTGTSTDTSKAASTSSSAASTSGTASSGSSKPLEVVIWDTNQQAGLQQIADLFTEETGIKVDIQVKDWDSYWTLLEAGATGGDMPDVFWMHSNNSQMYMKNDILLKLDDYIEKSDTINLDNYMPEVTELYQRDGSTYAIPKDYDTIALWYNKTMFDAAGLSYPDDTWTWDDMYDAAVKLTKADGSQYGFAMNPSNDQDTYYNMVYSMGGYIVSDDHKSSGYDDPNTLKAMDYVGKLLTDACPSATTMSETGTDVMMQSGTVAMIMQGSWMTAGFLANDYMKENCDVAILPYDATTGKRASICNGLGWAAYSGTDRPDDCWKLLEWFGSEAMQKKQAELGVTMSAYNNTSDAWVNCTDVFNLKPYLDIAKESTSDVKNELILRPYTYNSTVWSMGASTALVNAWSDPTQMEKVCTDFAAEMNKAIAAENK
ncbi:MAG: sugar ABC transporter substrate-binding protein [Lachnospiraceae bacterium]|nr:sugar ABC transporter substrate-binding protein [Lachnospiraceae bacterium]